MASSIVGGVICGIGAYVIVCEIQQRCSKIKFNGSIGVDQDVKIHYGNGKFKLRLYSYRVSRAHGALVLVPENSVVPPLMIHLKANMEYWDVSISIFKKTLRRSPRFVSNKAYSFEDIVKICFIVAREFGNYGLLSNNCLTFRSQLLYKFVYNDY